MSKEDDRFKKACIMVENPRYTEPVLPASDTPIRCPYCGRIAFRGELGPGSVLTVKCSRYVCQKIFRLAT